MQIHAPLSNYTDVSSAPLLFHMLSVGEGLMILIVFSDKTTMLYDCNIIQDDQEWILSYLGKHIPKRYNPATTQEEQWIDIFVNSHRDLDHYRGLKFVNELYTIRSIWDSGETGETTEDKDYQYYMQLRRDLIKKNGSSAVIIPVPSMVAMRQLGSAAVYCLNSSQEFSRLQASMTFNEMREVKVQHTNAIVLVIKYAGRSILLTSDSDWKAWKEKIVPNFANSGLLQANILVASHHGSRSFFTDEAANDDIDQDENPDNTYVESLEYIKPSITLISCGDYDQFHHPNEDAMVFYKKHTPHEQVYTTKKRGSLTGFIDMLGKWTIVPMRFIPKSNCTPSFDIKCTANLNGQASRKQSGDSFSIESKLEFSVLAHGGLIDPYDSVDVYWEVSNGGINSDHDHQEIYDKQKTERGDKLYFYRDVAYEGRHLLRCRVKNKKKNYDVTRVFVVNGVHA